MKHIDNYSVLLFEGNDDTFEMIAIMESAYKENIRQMIVALFDEWCYDEDEETMELLDKIVDSLFSDNYFNNGDLHFKIESVPFYK